jgi:hypothetical protein
MSNNVTPTKSVSRGVIVQNVKLCLSCSEQKSDRYIIIDANGNYGAAHDVVSSFYQVTFADVIANYGCYVCKACRKQFDVFQNHVRRCAEVNIKIRSKTQSLIEYSVEKRAIISSPLAAISKRLNRQSTPSRIKLFSPKVLSPNKKSINKNQTKLPHTCAKTVQVRFKSVTLLKMLQPICLKIANGAVIEALTMLFAIKNSNIKRACINFIKRLIASECKTASKLKQSDKLRMKSVKYFEDVNVREMESQCKLIAPITWNILTTICGQSKTAAQLDHRVLVAFSILFQARNRNFNVVQKLISMILYQNHLQKQGFRFLCTLGLSVSYDTMLRLRKQSAEIVKSEMSDWTTALYKVSIIYHVKCKITSAQYFIYINLYR